MKIFSRVRKLFSKRILTAAAAIAVTLLLPVATSAANVRFEMTMGAANVTAGDTTYKEAVNAKYDQVVKVQVYYHNMEDSQSNKVAHDVRLKLNVPTTAGTSQTITGSMSSPDINTASDNVKVNLDRSDAYLEYIPGSAVWKHNKGTNDNVQITEEKISDDVVLNGQGLRLEDTKPCFNFDATVTILVRVRVPGVKIVKQSRVKGSGQAWSNDNTAKPGETMEYLITYQNIGNTKHEDVVIRDNLPPKMQYVPGSTYLTNSTNPSGVKYASDNITNGGIVIGGYNPGAGGYVKFDVTVPAANQLACGVTEFRNVGVAKPKGFNEYYNTAITKVTKECAEQPKAPVCDSLELTKLDAHKIKVTVKPVVNGGTFKNVTYDFGDGSTPLTTDKTTVEYTYSKDGEYTVSTTLRFTVSGKEVVVNSDSCSGKVTFTTPATPPTTTTSLPNTGAGDVIGIVSAVTIAGAFAHRFIFGRKQSV